MSAKPGLVDPSDLADAGASYDTCRRRFTSA